MPILYLHFLSKITAEQNGFLRTTQHFLNGRKIKSRTGIYFLHSFT